ncbi:MAG: S8 family serine peptidase, partial [Planctomycetes bacterium]|nr:S8 family serine peptidase [Planctomycetota bacterium]
MTELTLWTQAGSGEQEGELHILPARAIAVTYRILLTLTHAEELEVAARAGVAHPRLGQHEYVVPDTVYGALRAAALECQAFRGVTTFQLDDSALQDAGASSSQSTGMCSVEEVGGGASVVIDDLLEAGGEGADTGNFTISSGNVNDAIPDLGFAWRWVRVTSGGAPAGARTTLLEYRLRIHNDSNPGSIYCGDYEIYLSSAARGGAVPHFLVYDNLGGRTDGGADDDTEDDSDIYLNLRTTSHFNAEDPNQQWYVFIRDTESSDTGFLQFIEFRVHWETPPPTVDLIATEVYFRDRPGNDGARIQLYQPGLQLYPHFAYTVNSSTGSVTGKIWNIELDGVVQCFFTGTEPSGARIGWCLSPWTATPGNHTLRGVLDPDGTIAETSEGNNVSSLSFIVPGVDLLAGEVYFRDQPGNAGNRVDSPQSGQQLYPHFSYTVDSPTGSVTGKIWNIELDGSVLCSISGTEPAGSRVGWCLAPWTVTAGNHTLRGVLDPDRTIQEINENNNTASRSFNASGADLVAGELFFRDQPGNGGNRIDNPRLGQQLYPHFAYTVNSTTGSVTGKIWNIELDGAVLCFFSGTEPAGARVGWCLSPWTVTAGSHTLRGILDPDGTIPESNETNNIGSLTFNGTGIPEIRVQPLTLTFESDSASQAGRAAPMDAGAGMADPAGAHNAGASSHYYYYQGRKQWLTASDKEVALFSAVESTGEIGSSLSAHIPGLKRLMPIGRTGVWLLEFWDPMPDVASGVAAVASQGGGSFVSPVFGGIGTTQVVVTPSILCRFRSSVPRGAQLRTVASLPDVKVTQDGFGRMADSFKLTVTARGGLEVLEMANRLAERPEVEWAEPDMMVMGFTPPLAPASVQGLPHGLGGNAEGGGTLAPNDPGFSNCWGILNTGQFTGAVVDVDMDGELAWDTTTGDPSVTVVVIDTGVEQNHPDINQRQGRDFTSDSGDGGPVNSFDSHGTAVAGCVAARINNSLGTVGIAPSCRVASARTFISTDAEGHWTTQLSWTVDALAWAETIGARVTNNSNAYDTPSNAVTTKYAETRQRGMIHFAANGNNAQNSIAYPASLPSVNGVAALDWNGSLAGFSNFGPGTDFAAPGRQIYSTDRQGAAGYTAEDYAFVYGTSFASPYTAGVAALVLSANPNLTGDEVESILSSTAQDLGSAGYDTTFGHGIPNAARAVEAARIGGGGPSFTVFNDGTAVLSVTSITLESSAPWISFSPASFEVASGGSQQVQVSVDFDRAPAGDSSVRLLVYSNDADESPYPGGVFVVVRKPVFPPSIAVHPQDRVVNPGDAVTFAVTASGTPPLSYQWRKDELEIAGATSAAYTIPA